MKNCVGKGYARDVLAGVSYIYRVLHPQRCTLELGFRHDGTLYIKELKGVENCPPGSATKRFIKDWLTGKHRSMHD